MAAKLRYTLSEIEPDKVGSGWHIRATPNGYAPELVVSFESEAEARSWLSADSQGWLAKLESSRNANRPRDPAQLAKLVVDIATSNAKDTPASDEGPMSALGRAGGLRGGRARAEKLSAKKRAEIASAAAHARWGKRGDGE
ncbi:MAG: hypothetical protein WA745_09365 [Methylovirgula sp.]